MILDCVGTGHTCAGFAEGARTARVTVRPTSLPCADAWAEGLTLCATVLLSRDHVWTWPSECTSKLTKYKHADTADKLKFIETDKNAPTQDYS